MNLQETILAIQVDGEHQQRLGDIAHAAGQLERAETHYLRARVARDEGLLLQSNTEVSDPQRCFEIQDLIKSADQYKLIKWSIYEPKPDGDQDD